MKKFFSIENILISVIILISIFSSSDLMTDHNVVPRQLFTALSIFVAISIITAKIIYGRKLSFNALHISYILTIISSFEAIYAIFQFCIFKYFNVGLPVVGSFENPVGLMSCLCLTLPFSLYATTKTTHHKNIFIGLSGIIFIGILLSQSRTGVIASTIILFYYMLYLFKFSATKRALIILISSIILIIALYYINSASINGRLLILRSCWPLILSTPFYGYGIGAFGRLYMEAQAKHLSAYSPDEDYAMLADSTIVPFNEYVNFYLSFGCLGIIVLIALMILIIKLYLRNPDDSKIFGAMALCTLAFISFFSYPFTYPFTYVITLVAILIITKDIFKTSTFSYFKKVFAGVALIASIYCTYGVCNRILLEVQWGDALRKGDIISYAKLEPDLGHIPHFLYSYAMEAYKHEDYALSLTLANQCASNLSHYDLELLLGDIYLKQENFQEAENHYKQASQMIPCRFIPLYALYNTYEIAGEKDKAIDMAQTIVSKRIKVKSRTVGLIRHKMQKVLNGVDQ